MSSKTITIREEVYEKLTRFKGEKSFSELLEELVEERETDRREAFNAWKGDKEELKENIEEGREKLEEDFGKRLN